jgi:hypothetical protein
MVWLMMTRWNMKSRIVAALIGVLMVVPSDRIAAEPTAAATSAFDAYVRALELRLAQQHRSPSGFVVVSPQEEARLQLGEFVVEQFTPSAEQDLPGAMLHHWRGTAFVPGATMAEFERLMQDFSSYPRSFSPQVLRASVLSRQGDRMQVTMRVRQQHILTVVMDTSYDVTFARLDAQHGYSVSRSTRIAEIESRGTSSERVLGPGEEHGFLWRMNTYWSYEERDGGLLMQIESVSLTRSIPRGLGWAVRPFVESVPRESLEFTLRSVSQALRR